MYGCKDREEITLKDRENFHYAVRMVAVFILISIFITPSIMTKSPGLISNQGQPTPTADLGVQPIKVDPQLTKLINNQTNDDVSVIVVFRDEAAVKSAEEANGIGSHFRLITTFTIIPAVLIEGPLNKVSELFSSNQIHSIYLNKEISASPINATVNSEVWKSSASSWIQAIDPLPSSIGNGSGVIVAVCDSGIYTAHPDLAEVIANMSFVNTKYGYLDNETKTTDDLGHGTYVAGIISARATSAYPGVAPGVKLLNAKCIDEFGRGFGAGIIKAIEWANASGADVINLSLGGGSADPEDPISLAVDAAVRSGVVVVSAAGNEGPYYSSGSVPGAALLGISVGAANTTSSPTSIASFSSRGPTIDGRPYPDVLAPGVDIISALASGSAIADYADRLRLSSGNYVELSGTSAATPIVSGAVALLLSAIGLRQLNRSTLPQTSLVEIASTIRIALMHTASSIGADINTQGSGMIDVYSAYNYLHGFGTRLHYPIVQVSPSALVNPPYNISFLGDSIAPTVSISTASKMNLNVVSSGNATAFMEFSNLSFTNIVGETSLEVNITIPVNAKLGRYTAQIGFMNGTSLLIGENVSVSFTVKNPTGRVYIDLFHTSSSFSTESTLYKYGSMLTGRGYSTYESNNPITYSTISQYDVLVLTDPLVMFSVEEVNAIHKFIEDNGSILVLGNDYPDIASEAVNAITAQYGIQYTRNLTAAYEDLALADVITSMINITNLASHPVTAGVTKYLFGYGSTLSVSNPAVSLAFAPSDFGNLPVLAAYNSSKGGRIVATGSLLFTTDDNLLDSSYPGNLKLAQNIIDWLLAGRNVSAELIANNTRVKTYEPLRIGIVVTNRTNGGLLAANVTCTASNGSSYLIKLHNDTNGIYYNMSTAFQTQGFYTIDVKAELTGLEIERTLRIEVVDTPPEISNVSLTTYHSPSISYPLPTYYQSFLPGGTPIISRYGDFVNITIRVSGFSPSPNSNVTVYLTRSPTFYIPNNKPLTYVTLKAVSLNSTTYRAQFRPNLSNGSDVYQYWISANDGGYTSSFNQVNVIMVASIDPEISNSTTTINSRPLSDLRQPQGNALLLYPMTVSMGDTISIVVNGSDVEDSGNTSKMRAWAVLLDPSLYIVPGIVDAELIVSAIPFNSATSTFEGNLTIPANGIAFMPGSQTGLSLVNRLFYIMIVLADSDGAYSTDFAGVYITPKTQPIPAELIFLILGAAIAIPIIIIILIEKRTKKRVAEGPTPTYYPSPPNPENPVSIYFQQ
jgi:subtilisin family serine protease